MTSLEMMVMGYIAFAVLCLIVQCAFMAVLIRWIAKKK